MDALGARDDELTTRGYLEFNIFYLLPRDHGATIPAHACESQADTTNFCGGGAST
jgi:hypothetical protein